MNTKIKTQVIILGGGPSGYSAAFRCADLGLNTILVERYSKLGGVCLNVGCIPSKSLLHISKIIKETNILINNNIFLNKQKIDINKIRIWKEEIIKKIADNLSNMAKIRKIKVLNGYGKFITSDTIQIEDQNNKNIITFDNAIIATGSYPIQSKFFLYDDPRIWNSSDALNLTSIPKKLMIIGGGIIGLEIATIYHSLGSNIDIIELSDQIIPTIDKDISNIFIKHVHPHINLMLETKVNKVETKKNGIYVTIEKKDNYSETKCYDAVLIAIGRKPNSKLININKIGIETDSNDFINVDEQMRTNIPNIYAIGDVVGQPMLAHKGIYEGHLVAEVIANKKHYFNPKIIPCISYTHPEIAWAGLTEKEAKKNNIQYETAIFPWKALGRAIISDYHNGITKLIFDKKNHNIIGGTIIGENGSELLGEICLAIEMNCSAEDIALTIHSHPTLHESIGLAAKIYEGTITDLLNVKKIDNILL